MTATDRFHSLDALRALMMWLGIVLHSAMVYMEPGIDLHRSRETSLIATSLFGWIHIYRMPVFFMLAGFFTCLLVERRGVASTLVHRAKRIGLPFLLFWPILLVSINIVIEAHSVWLDPASEGITLQIKNWVVSTGHLWFLYYLIWFTPAAILMTQALKRFLPTRFSQVFLELGARLLRSWWGPLLLSIPAALLSAGYPASIMTGDGAFWPTASSLAYYAIFYIAGWVLFVRRSELLSHFAEHWWMYLAAALPLFVAANVLGFMALGLFGEAFAQPEIDLAFRAAYSYAVWLWSGAFLGLFLRFFRKQSQIGRYLSDSSYWVYLSHYPIVLGLAYVLYPIRLSALTKMAILIALTSLFCLVSYDLVVRRGWIGRLLNGRRGRPQSSKGGMAVDQNTIAQGRSSDV